MDESATLPPVSDEFTARSVNAGRIGTAVEQLVAASCVLASGARLNVSTSMVDDEGVDLVFHRRGEPTTLAVQVKSRGTDTSVVRKGQFVANVRDETFRPRADLYVLGVVIDRPTAHLGRVWFVPSHEYDRLANRTGKNTRRITANVSAASRDKWSPFRMEFHELPDRILSVLDELAAR